MISYHLKLDLYPQDPRQEQRASIGTTTPATATQQQGPPDHADTAAAATYANSLHSYQTILAPFPKSNNKKPVRGGAHSNISNKDLREKDGQEAAAHEKDKDSTSLTKGQRNYRTTIDFERPKDYRFGSIQIAFLDDDKQKGPISTSSISFSSTETLGSSSTSTHTATSTPTTAKDRTTKNRSRGGHHKKEKEDATNNNSSNNTTGGMGGFQELTPASGVLHLYRGVNEITTGEIVRSKTTSTTSEQDSTEHLAAKTPPSGEKGLQHHDGTTLCVLAVPSYMSPGDFLNFVGPVRQNASHFRIIRDSAPNRFMVLIKFRSPETASEFYTRYNGRPFSSMEPEICHVVYLESIEIRAGSVPPYALPFFHEDPFLKTATSTLTATAASESVGLAISSTQQTSPSTSSKPLVASATPSTTGITELTEEEIEQAQKQGSRQQDRLEGEEEDSLSASLEELPTCPVCLERMDSSLTGLLTILCQHTFHCHCLSKWGEGSCPVCRYSQKSTRGSLLNRPRIPGSLTRPALPGRYGARRSSRTGGGGKDSIAEGEHENDQSLEYREQQQDGTYPNGNQEEEDDDQNRCALCGTTDNLWICLICGHIGCGRYQDKHAYLHYDETSHLYALELETQRVWDYAGDGYVHRLIQNKADGKLVELPSAIDGTTLPSEQSVQVGGQEKLDAIGLEYTYLLTSQLESQRLYFDAQMASMSAQLAQVSKEATDMSRAIEALNEENQKLQELRRELERVQVPNLVKEKKLVEKRLEKTMERLQKLEQQYDEEKEMNVGLRSNQESFKEKLKLKEEEILELEDQVRDMMIYLSTQQKVEASPLKDEIVGGTVEVSALPPAPAPSTNTTSSSSSGRKKKK